MKWFWAILAAVIATAIIVAFQPPRAARDDAKGAAMDAALINEATSSGPVPARPEPAPSPPPSTPPANNAKADALVKDLMTPRADKASKPLAGEANAKAAVTEPEGVAMTDGLDVTLPNAKVAPGRLLRKTDGSILADGKWLITGDGTERNPYIVPWELLVSAMDTYQPRSALRDIPQRVAFLDGKRVRVDGYIIFPLIVQQSQQCLLTFNQWDGCCIGVPPSAYDAIEVNLASSIPVNRKHGLLFGGVEGILHVAPLLADGWLYGLYAMDDARLKLEM